MSLAVQAEADGCAYDIDVGEHGLAQQAGPLGSPLLRGGRPINIVLMGPPAGGKGTQAEFLVERYGMVHISVGDLLRARAKVNPRLASDMVSGRLVPDDVVSAVLKERLADRDCAARGVLLDGFPRTMAQAEALRAVGVDVAVVILLDVAEHVVVDRVAGRRIDPISGKVYHVNYNPPPPEVAGRVIQRDDDTPNTVHRRLAAYNEQRGSVQAFYGDRVKAIQVGGSSPSSLPADVRAPRVFDEVRKILEGDTYWGAVVRSEVVAKSVECGTRSTSLVTVARYFEHLREGLLRNGCMAEAVAQASRVLLRAQVVDLDSALLPSEQYELRAWLEQVGSHSLVVGHALSRRLPNGDAVDLARGSAALVLLTAEGKVMDVPGLQRLEELAAPTTALQGHSPVNDVQAASPKAMAETIGDMPAGCWRCSWCVAAMDLNVSGVVHEAACIAYLEQARFNAAAEGGYPPGINELVLAASTARAYVAYLGSATQGDMLDVFSWLFEPRTALPGDANGALHLAFEVRARSSGALRLHGALVVVPPTRDPNATGDGPGGASPPLARL